MPAALPRKNSIDTLGQALRLALGYPALLVAFLAVEIVDTLGETTTVVFSVVAFVLSLFVGGLAYVYAERALAGDGSVTRRGADAVSLGEAADRVLPRMVSLVGVAVVYVVVVTIGLLLLVVPGIYVGARLILAYPACVLDDRDAVDSLATGWEAGGGNVLKLVGIFLVLLLALFGVAIVPLLAGGVALLENAGFLLALAPVAALVNATVEIAIGRVYLENRVRKRTRPAAN